MKWLLALSQSYLLNIFFVPLILLIFLILWLTGRRCERGYEMPKNVMEGGGLDYVAQQPVERLVGKEIRKKKVN